MNKSSYLLVILFCAILFPCDISGQQSLQKKHSLLHPVPIDSLRDMETDRPDVTESPYTVDAGHIQFETDLVRLVTEKSKSQQTRTLLINQINVKIGITNSTALQIGFETYGRKNEKDLESGTTETTNGHGDLSLRIKQNLVGNDDGNFALALLPYVKFPTSKYDEESKIEAGLIVPMVYKLPGDWKLGFQLEVDRLKDQDQQTMHTEFLQSLTISHPLMKGIDGIAETYYTYDFKAHHWSNYINAAIQIEVMKDFKLDAGLNYGIQHSAEKHYFLGAAFRL